MSFLQSFVTRFLPESFGDWSLYDKSLVTNGGYADDDSEMENDFDAMFPKERQKEIALAIFLNEPAANRLRDVRKTEILVPNVFEYDPATTDYPGVDTQGANPFVELWEETDEARQNTGFVAPTAVGQKRLLYFYDLVMSARTAEIPVRPWYVTSSVELGYRVVILNARSRLYRSSWVENWAAAASRKWYTNLTAAAMYNDVHFAKGDRQKEIAVFQAAENLTLVDFTHYDTVMRMFAEAKQTKRAKVVNAFLVTFCTLIVSADASGAIDVDNNSLENPPGLRDNNGDVLVRRVSNVDIDNIITEWFDEQHPEFDGWCFLQKRGSQTLNNGTAVLDVKTEILQHHHDEFYISRPQEKLQRLQYIIKQI